MTKEEFVEKVMQDQYLRKLQKRRKFLCNDADVHSINSTKRTQIYNMKR
ncbi:hypothetical protein [uncultured Clostridium sp.]|jgi:hypothetical protein|nr:hypothetical protein [uncultured Clostridium sp.]